MQKYPERVHAAIASSGVVEGRIKWGGGGKRGF